MRALIQRVSGSSVAVNGETVGKIGRGLLVLLGVGKDDRETDADLLADKVANLRIFDDEAGKMNLSILEVQGEVLAVSQFTLFADSRRGRRPSYIDAAPPEEANRLYEYFMDRLRSNGVSVQAGRFQAMMDVELVNNGPVTIWLDTDELKSKK
ncbi:MAG TPA: D-tyrosyl-tRNA(Tyr) deacylase [Blastocatellia bacterium]|mgnify:CR=1 FL=1|nr:D-tyrosyl-tRNA(Tyr) deacylase [Blastocatellia bacterium]